MINPSADLTRDTIIGALIVNGSIVKTSRALNVNPSALYRRMKALKIKSNKRGPRLPVPPTKMPRPASFKPIACPCCSQIVDTPDLEIVIDHYRVPPGEQAILRAVWRARGQPIKNERIFRAMYANDPDGGPAPTQMYRAFKALMHNLRCRLVGSGITIESAGYNQGYRLVIGGHGHL